LYKKTNMNISGFILYSYKFATLFKPSTISDLSLINLNNNNTNNKILIKQSYLILMWISYITNKNSSKFFFYIYPKKIKIKTIIKAPMAHKTFSQEQLSLKYYQLSTSFKINTIDVNYCNSVNNTIHFYYFLKNLNYMYGTNLLFLKRMSFIYYFKDNQYLNYFKFIQ